MPSVLAGRYAIERELGRGGMARVFLARDTQGQREVAIKLLHRELGATTLADRFQREIAVLSRLRHPNIVTLLDAGEDQGTAFFVMDYVPRPTLREQLTRHATFPVERTVALARDLAAALDYAHAEGVVHRDIKPENILMDETTAMLCDFGIVRVFGPGAWERLSSSGLIPGTAAYMSPEQAVEPAKVDGRADIYALGCVLFEMLTGEPAFSGRTPQVVIARHMAAPPPRLRVLRPEIPEHVERALQRALAKAPAERQATASEFVRGLERPAG